MNKCLKVNICGAPSSRKSTVCAGLEAKLKQDGIITETSKEYVRHYINSYGLPTELFEQFIIHENQTARDEAIASVSQVMLSDNPAMASYIFGKRMLMRDMKARGLTEMSKAHYKFLEEMHTKALKRTLWFDLIIVFPHYDPIVLDGTRTETTEEKREIYDAIVGFLHVEGIPYHWVSGTVDERIEKCYQLIKERIGK
jgi:nicotinamide riboside kinase